MIMDKMKILIIDDDTDDVYLIRELLKDITVIQFELLHEKSLKSALELLEKERPNCILLDLNLPDSLGTDTLKNVINKHADLPIVILTVIDDEDTAIKSLHDGAQDYLVKGKINGEIISKSVSYAIERKKIENALRESEKKYKNIVDTILEGLWTTDTKGKTTYVNRQLAKMLGYSPEEILNQPFFNFVDESLRNDAKKLFDRRRKGIKDRYDFRFVKKDSSIIWVIVSASPIFDENGKFVGALGLLTDITKRKLMEQSLEKSVQVWDSTFNAIADTVCIVDQDGKITNCNAASQTLFKKACKDIIGKNCFDVLTCPPDRLKDCPIIKSKKTKIRETLTVKVNDKWYHSSLDPIINKTGNIVGGVHIISDITKYKLAQEALIESELALKKSQQIAHIGHWTWYTKTNKLIWSDEMFDIFGISKEEFEGFQADLDKVIDRAIHPEDREKVRESNKAKLQGQLFPLEYRIVWPDNTIHTVYTETGEKSTNESGNIIKLFGTVQDITERKQAEERLRNSQKMLADAQRVAHIGSWEWDIDTKKITWSEELFHLYNSDPKLPEPTYEELLEFHHPEDRSNFEHVFEEAVKKGTPFTTTYRIIIPEENNPQDHNPDNSIRYIEARGEIIRDNKGSIVKLYGTAMDVTDHKIAEQKITDLKNFYENILDGFISGVWVTDKNDKIFYCNKGMITIAGVPKEEMINKIILKDFPENTLKYFKPLYNQSKSTLKPLFFESILIFTPSGRHSYQSGWLIPLLKVEYKAEYKDQYENKQTNTKTVKFDGMICTMNDVTEQKIVQDRLKESEELYRTITENSNDMIWTLDKDGNFTFFNKRSEQISGYKLQELKGKNFGPLIIKQDLDRTIEIFKATLNGQSQQYEVTFINKYNKPISLAINTSPIYSKGQIIGTISSGRDITETARYTKELKIMAQKLEASNKELEQFAYIASHDLQEPLRSIYSFTELLARRYKGRFDPDADKFIDYIENGTKRMQLMIDDLLALSRVETRGKEFLPTNVSDALNDVSKNLHSMIERNNAVITINDMPIIDADSSQLIQLFQNLIDNAIKFRREEPPNIHISAKKVENEYIFSIQDNGIGINEKDFKKLFKAFSRLHSRDKYPGTGIGLVICKKIVERHKGRIWLESKPGYGSTFYFTIPIYQNDRYNKNAYK